MTHIPQLDEILEEPDIAHAVARIASELQTLSAFGRLYDELSPEQKTVYCTQIFETEVNNGGIEQYFLNSYGDRAEFTVRALRVIGAEKTALILESALSALDAERFPEIRSERLLAIQAASPNVSEFWETLDQEFYKYTEDLNLLNWRYIVANRDCF